MENKEAIAIKIKYFDSMQPEGLNINEAALENAYNQTSHQQSLAIKILSAVGAILACLAFIGFLFITGLFDSKAVTFILGALCIVVPIVINKVKNYIIIDTISISIYLIGYVLLAFSAELFHFSNQQIPYAFIIIALLSLVLVQSYMMSFLSIFIITCSTILICIDHTSHGLHFFNIIIAIMLGLAIEEANIKALNIYMLRLCFIPNA